MLTALPALSKYLYFHNDFIPSTYYLPQYEYVVGIEYYLMFCNSYFLQPRLITGKYRPINQPLLNYKTIRYENDICVVADEHFYSFKTIPFRYVYLTLFSLSQGETTQFVVIRFFT
jgi:hypothetical protein